MEWRISYHSGRVSEQEGSSSGRVGEEVETKMAEPMDELYNLVRECERV